MSRARPGAGGEKEAAATLPGVDLGRVFAAAVARIRDGLDGPGAVVDVEMTFRSMTVDSRGIPLISNRTEQSSVEMRLATRVSADSMAGGSGSDSQSASIRADPEERR